MAEKEGSNHGGALQKVVTKATDMLIDSVSSLANSAIEEGSNRVQEFSLKVCKQNLRRMASNQSIVTANPIAIDSGFGDKVIMSPLIEAMLRVCFLTSGSGTGCTWVVCAPTDQGKTLATQFLIHGKHGLRPKRSLKIDATNMTNFAKDFSEKTLKCGAAENSLSMILCGALTSSESDTSDAAGTNANANVGTGTGQRVAEAAAAATDLAGQFVCNVENTVAFGSTLEMKDAEKHKILKLKSSREDGEPRPILVIDECYCETEENKQFFSTLIRDAAATGVIVFLITKNPAWASQLILLNGGTKCKPLPTNIGNLGYTGATRFDVNVKAEWNQMFWPVTALRDLIRPFCAKHFLNPSTVVPDDQQEITPGEAMRMALELQMQDQLKRL